MSHDISQAGVGGGWGVIGCGGGTRGKGVGKSATVEVRQSEAVQVVVYARRNIFNAFNLRSRI